MDPEHVLSEEVRGKVCLPRVMVRIKSGTQSRWYHARLPGWELVFYY